MDSTSLTKPVDLQGLSLALAKTKADYEAQINKLAVPPDWEMENYDSFAYILNKPAIKAGEGRGSIVEGGPEEEETSSTSTILITGDAGAKTYGYTTENTLPDSGNLSIAKYGSSTYRAITNIDTTNHTITFDRSFNASSALANASVTIYDKYHWANGLYSHSEGFRSMTFGSHSHAEGNGCITGQSSAHAEGSLTKAFGSASHSEGTATLANAQSSHAEGRSTIAASSYQHVQGKFNIEDSNNVYAHIVGNGSSTARSNAHTLDWNGNAWYAGKVSAGTVASPANPVADNDLATKAYVDDATASITDEKVSTGTIGNDIYYPIVGTNTSSATTKYIDSTGFKYDATSSTNGYARLYLGNGTASGTTGSKSGRLMIYGTTAYGVTLDSGSPTENRTISLPNKNGTIALTSDIPTKVSDLTNDSGFITSYTETDPIFVASAAHGITSSDISNWNSKTSNTGTVTQVTAGTGLSIGSTAGGNFTTSGTINHTNSVTAQNVQAIYPIKIDAQGHISEYGSAVTPLTASSTLDATKLSGTVPAACLPSYVDDVLEYSSQSSFPATGESGKIYVDISTNLTYRWSGSAYVEISPSLALGTTSSTAFRGDYGQSAYAHAVTNKGSAFSSGLYKITTNSEGHVTNATAVQKSDITGLGIPAQDTTYIFDGTYNASTNKAATVSTVTNAVSGKANTSDVLTKTNTTSYTPTANYHPATKKYVDDSISGFSTDLSGLSDTTITTPADGQLLKYNATSGKWENVTLSLAINNNVIQLKEGNTVISSVTLPVYNGGVSS